MGRVIDMNPEREVQCSNGQTATLREIKIGDDYSQAVKVTLWGEQAKLCIQINQKVKISNGTIAEWNGWKYINCSWMSSLEFFN
jgi:ssDNA-binding replication factor A large subunit